MSEESTENKKDKVDFHISTTRKAPRAVEGISTKSITKEDEPISVHITKENRGHGHVSTTRMTKEDKEDKEESQVSIAVGVSTTRMTTKELTEEEQDRIIRLFIERNTKKFNSVGTAKEETSDGG